MFIKAHIYQAHENVSQMTLSINILQNSSYMDQTFGMNPLVYVLFPPPKLP